jgi:Mrp family chromosome partitioning ATPase
MENIRQAVERARVDRNPPASKDSGMSHASSGLGVAAQDGHGIPENVCQLNTSYLQSKRILAYDGSDQRSRPYDMLRTQVSQSMTVGGWKILGVTSPGPGCGKTLTATNLAFSMARQSDQSVILVDLDLQKPQVANTLGIIPANGGALDLLQERHSLAGAAIPVRAGDRSILVVPTASTRESSELIGSRAMRNLLQEFRRNYRSHIVILDLPPMLSSDDVISLLPQIDCVLLVAAVGTSKATEIEECNRHLKSCHLVRLVVNKCADANTNYYYY